MKAWVLQTATAAAAAGGAAATRPQCAVAAPLLSTFLQPLHHRRFQSNRPNSSPPPKPPNKQSKADPATINTLLSGLLTDSPSSSSSSDSPPPKPANKQSKANSDTLDTLLSGLLTDSPSSSSTTINNNNYNNNNNNLLSNYSLPASFSSRSRHSPSSPTNSPHSLLANLGLTSTSSTSTSFFDQTLGGPPIVEETLRVPRMGPTAGRSVLVQGDVTVAFTKLKGVVQANRVRSDLMKQRFHERPGLKKKRLKRERHRKRFKEAFKKMVGIVLDMKNRGM